MKGAHQEKTCSVCIECEWFLQLDLGKKQVLCFILSKCIHYWARFVNVSQVCGDDEKCENEKR